MTKSKLLTTCMMLLVAALVVVSCAKSGAVRKPNVDAAFKTILIHPAATDSLYSMQDNEHYIVRSAQLNGKKLLLFLGGSFSNPKDYYLFCEYAASVGFDVISLSYPNSVGAAPLGVDADKFIFDHYRQEICFGTPLSDKVRVDTMNSIVIRASKLIHYLDTSFPDQGWARYIHNDGSLNGQIIALGGHSQGAGHAAYLAKKIAVDRVLMFSGPNDYSTYWSAPAEWLSMPGRTPKQRHFALLHEQDEIVPFSQQIENMTSLGILSTPGQIVRADQVAPPFKDARVLSLRIPALSFHSSTVGGNAILPMIWNYMLTAN